MSNRRSRFTITFLDGSREVFLGYSALSAENYYNGRGRPVVSVTKGDYRMDKNVTGGGFKIIQSALKTAQEELGLTIPVKVRFNARQGNTNGNYRFRGTHHDIMVKSYLTPEEASSTLWHELTHAMQAERCGGTTETWTKVHREQRNWTYRQRPIEIEANAMSAAKADVLLCA